MKKKMLPNEKKSGFTIPKNYFSDFEDRWMDRLRVDVIAGNSSKGNAGFKVPENYFDQFEEKLLEKVGVRYNPTKVLPLYRKKKLYYAAAIAAVFTGILSTLFFSAPGVDLSVKSLELSTLESYLDEEYINFDKKEISVFMMDDSYSLYNFNASRLSDEAVYEYIDENIEDPNLLLE